MGKGFQMFSYFKKGNLSIEVLVMDAFQAAGKTKILHKAEKHISEGCHTIGNYLEGIELPSRKIARESASGKIYSSQINGSITVTISQHIQHWEFESFFFFFLSMLVVAPSSFTHCTWSVPCDSCSSREKKVEREGLRSR